MKKLAAFALSLVSASVFATSTVGNLDNVPDVKTEAKQGFHGQVGLAVASLPEYIGGDETEGVALPLINVSYNDTFYFKYNRLGAWLLKSESGFRLGGVIMSHAGYDKEDGDLLIVDRDDSTMAGVNLAYSKGLFSTEVGFVKDVSDTSEGSKFYAQAQYTMVATPKYTVSVSAKLENWDEDLVGYYYGNYESASNASLALIGTYKLNDKWTLLGAVSATSLGDEISDSPIVEDDTYNGVLVGATYSF